MKHKQFGRERADELGGLCGLYGAFVAVSMWDRSRAAARLRNANFWLYTFVSLAASSILLAICVYGILDIVNYMQHTTPCQRMGSC